MSRIKDFIILCILSFHNLCAGYPDTPRISKIDRYHDIAIEDPYRWLENGDNPDVQAWDRIQDLYFIESQKNNSHKSRIYRYLKEAIAKTHTETLILAGSGRLLTCYQDPDQHAPQFFIQQHKHAPLELLFDPNTLGNAATVPFFEASPNGNYLLLGVEEGGNETPEFFLFDLATLTRCSDTFQGSRHIDPIWTQNSKGFYYCANPEPGHVKPGEEYFWTAIYFHKLGTSKERDRLLIRSKTVKDWFYSLSSEESNSGIFLYIYRARYSQRAKIIKECYWLPLNSPNSKPKKLFEEGENAISEFPIEIGGKQYLLSNRNAKNFQLLKIINAHKYKTVIKEGTDLLQSVSGIDGKFAATYLEHGHHKIKIFNEKGDFLYEVPLPAPGIAFLESRWKSRNAQLLFSSLIQPDTLYEYHPGKNILEKKTQIPILGYEPNHYVTEHVFTSSQDGTPIPLHIAYKKGERPNYAFLYGYGGFQTNVSPKFYPIFLPWLQENAVLCISHLRGGGEYGEKWHQAGTRKNKQRVFDDFIAAAEYLSEYFVSANKIAAWGGSNGGLLTGACCMQRPDLFGAVVSAVPLLDMLRFHRFRMGYHWIGEYGCADNPKQFPFIYAYSPYHTIQEGVFYPSTLITTGLNDRRCDPLHARKMTAALQHADPNGRPHYLKVDTDAGHRFHSPLVTCKRLADQFGFLMKEINLKEKAIEKPFHINTLESRLGSFKKDLQKKQKSTTFDQELKERTELYRLRKKREQLQRRIFPNRDMLE